MSFRETGLRLKGPNLKTAFTSRTPVGDRNCVATEALHTYHYQ